jgi:hypothetical protein
MLDAYYVMVMLILEELAVSCNLQYAIYNSYATTSRVALRRVEALVYYYEAHLGGLHTTSYGALRN